MDENDPINVNSKNFFIPTENNVILESFKMCCSSFRVSKKIPDSNFYFPEEFYTRKNAEKNVSKNNTQSDKNTDVDKSTFKKDFVFEKPSSYPPPLPLDTDPTLQRMLHSWYWAGYYTCKHEMEKERKS